MASALDDPGFIEAVTSPQFLALPWEERRARIAEHVPEFKSSTAADQNTILGMIQKKGNVQPTPAGLQGPAPSRLSQAVTNLPYSVANSVINTLKGPQMGGSDTLPPSNGDNRSSFQKIGDFLKHPVDNTLDWAVDDPVAATQQVVALGKGGVEAAPAVIEKVTPAVEKTAAVVKGAAQGAREGLTMPVKLPGHGYAAQAARALGVENIPAPVAGAILGKYGTQMTGISHFVPGSEYAAAAIGAASPIVKQAYARAKQAAADYNASQMPARKPPLWANNAPAPETPVEAPATPPAPTELPSGRKPGGIQNQAAPQAPPDNPPLSPGGIPTGVDESGGGTAADIFKREMDAKAAARVAENPFEPTQEELDGAAKGFGQKNFGVLPPAYQESIRNAIRKAKEQAAAKAAAPPEVPTGRPYTPQPEEPGKTLQQSVDEEIAKRKAAREAQNPPENNAGAASEAQARRLEKDRQEFLQTIESERANQEPVAPERASTPEPEVAPPTAPEPQEQPATEVPAPVEQPHAPVENLDPGQAHPLPKNFGPTKMSDMPVLPGHTQISSEAVHSAGFDPETGHPEIHFHKPIPNGGLYRYPNLPPEELQKALANAPSFGAWVRQTLRANPEWMNGSKKVSVPENAPLLQGTPYGDVPKAETVGTPAPPVAKPESTIETGKVVQIPTSQISVDPTRFQFKANAGQGGAGEELRSVAKYDPEKAGVQAVWKDPADGKTYIVNGHNRLALAQRTGTPEVNAMYIDAKDAAEARTKGALINIAEGRGTAIDAAKVFRDSQMSPEELQKEGISPTGTVAKAGMALANLDPALFSKVVSGEIPIERASIIGEGVPNPADQKALYDLIKKRETSGKSMTNAQIGEMIRLTNEAPSVSETQDSLFGSQEMTRSLIPEKAEVSAYIRQQLSQEKKLFQAVANGSAAEKLGTAGNVIKAEENAKVAITAAQAQAIYDKLSTSAGAINNALDEAAQAIAKGSNVTNAKTIAYQKIKSELFKQAKSLAGTSETSP